MKRSTVTIHAIGAAALAILPTIASADSPASPSTAGTGCQFLSVSQPTIAFCETFDQPAGIGNRSGDLNGTLWGVSRLGESNLGQYLYNTWYEVDEQVCGQTVTVFPENSIKICGGRLVEAVNDDGAVPVQAMYPKQPFDIAGRAGTVVFDVSDDSQGNHAAWPEFWYSDQPVPTPFVHESFTTSAPRNGFGVRFASVCSPGQGRNCAPDPVSCGNNTKPVFTVDSAAVIRNFASFDTFQGTGGGLTVTPLACVTRSSGPGDMNHIELRVSQNEIDVYATDAGTTAPLREIAKITNANLTLTRGLVWLEHVQYNGNKMPGNNQGQHTFTWDNLGFDGPVLPRDLAFDVNDSIAGGSFSYTTGVFSNSFTALNGQAGKNLGWIVPTDGTSLTLQVPGVNGIDHASAGLMTLNYSMWDDPLLTLTYRLNNGAWHSVAPQSPVSAAFSYYTLAVPIALAEVVRGTNSIQFKAAHAMTIANIDLVMVGAGGTVAPSAR